MAQGVYNDFPGNDDFWQAEEAPAPSPQFDDFIARAKAAYVTNGGVPDADFFQDLAHRFETGQNVDEILAHTAEDARRRFPAASSAGETFTFANPAGAAAGAPQSIQPYGQTFGFDASKLGQTDGFTFKFDKAMQAIGRLGAAKGTYFNPQTWKAAQEEAAGLAGQEINDEYSRQADTFDRNYGVFRNNETDRYSSQRTNRMDDYGIYNSDRAYNRGVYENDRNFGYQQKRDDVGDDWRAIDYGYNASGYAR